MAILLRMRYTSPERFSLDMAKTAKTRTKVETQARAKIKTFPFDATETLDTPEAIAEYLSAAFETSDPSFIAKAVGTAARARGMSEIARDAGLSRENLYRSLDGETKAEFATIVRVLD